MSSIWMKLSSRMKTETATTVNKTIQKNNNINNKQDMIMNMIQEFYQSEDIIILLISCSIFFLLYSITKFFSSGR
jgi:hypothetical protein